MPVTLDKKAKTALVTIRPWQIIDENLNRAVTLRKFLLRRADKEFEEIHQELYQEWQASSKCKRHLGAKVYYSDFYWRITYDWSCDEET